MCRPSTWVCIAALGLLGPAARSQDAAGLAVGPAAGEERRLGRLVRAGGAAGPLDWVLEKLPAGADEWEAERLNDEVLRVLHELDASLEAGFEPTSALVAGFADAFEWRGLDGSTWTLRHQAPHVRVERAEGLAAARLEEARPASLLAALRRALYGAPRAASARSKVFGVSRGSGGERVTRVLLEVDGIAPGGDPVQLRAILDAGWEDHEGRWRLRRLEPLLLERARARPGVFQDASEAAFGANASYREQLLVGLEDWRRRIDSAGGIDIYGHQGIAVGDIDGDAIEDLYIPQPAGLPNLLYRGLGGGAYADITAGSGAGVLDTTGGAFLVELDGDGDLDLLVVTSLEPLLFENLGGGRFRRRPDAGFEAGGRAGASTLGAAAADPDQDGDLDVYIFSYVFWAGAGSRAHSSYPYPYHDANNGAPNMLYRNEGGLRFTDVTREAGLDVNNRRFSLAASWADYDDDGDPDLYVANDFGRNNLYRNRGDGTFEDVAAAAGVEDIGNGMSVAWEDYDNDGLLDLYVGNMWSSAGSRIAGQERFARDGGELAATYRRMARGNSLFRARGDGTFEDVSIASGASFGRWSWSSFFLDHDADGREDLFIANGFVTGEQPDDL